MRTRYNAISIVTIIHEQPTCSMGCAILRIEDPVIALNSRVIECLAELITVSQILMLKHIQFSDHMDTMTHVRNL